MNGGSLPALSWLADEIHRQDFDSGGRGPYHARAMGNPLHVRRTPLELAENSQLFEISGKISDFKRLLSIAGSALAAVDPEDMPQNWRNRPLRGELRFGFVDAQARIPALTGHLAAEIDAVCQRCLAPFVLPLESELRLVFGSGQSLEHAGETYESWELDDDRLEVAALVEEALIMTMPFVTMHADAADCVDVPVASDAQENMTLPFANLKSQMQQED